MSDPSKTELIHTSCRSESSNISLVVLDKDEKLLKIVYTLVTSNGFDKANKIFLIYGGKTPIAIVLLAITHNDRWQFLLPNVQLDLRHTVQTAKTGALQALLTAATWWEKCTNRFQGCTNQGKPLQTQVENHFVTFLWKF